MQSNEYRKIQEAYCNMYKSVPVCESFGGFLKWIFNFIRGMWTTNVNQVNSDNEDIDNDNNDNNDNNNNVYNTNKQNKPKKLFEIDARVIYNQLSNVKKIRANFTRFIKNNFKFFRYGTEDEKITDAICSIKTNNHSLNDCGVFFIAPIIDNGDVNLAKAILSYYSNYNYIWFNGSIGMTEELQNYLNDKCQKINNKQFFIRVKGDTGSTHSYIPSNVINTINSCIND